MSKTPFYFYEIPVLTGVTLQPSQFLECAGNHIPSLVGVKFTTYALMEYQLCRAAHDARFDIPFGFDENLLGALAVGAKGAVGRPIYTRMLKAFRCGESAAAREEQMRSVLTIVRLNAYGYMGAAKAVMNILGVDVGPARLPVESLNAVQAERLPTELEQLGFC